MNLNPEAVVATVTITTVSTIGVLLTALNLAMQKDECSNALPKKNKHTVSSTRAVELAQGRKFQLPLSNKFDGLHNDEDFLPITRKHKASSSLDYDKSLKKQRESQNEDSQDSDSSISFTEANKSAQCDPPANTVRFDNSSPEKSITVTHIPDSAQLNHGPIVSRDQTSKQDKSNSIIVD